MPVPNELRDSFLRAASAPLDSGHASGTLDEANALLAAHPEIASSDIHTSAVQGDDAAVRRHLASDPASATAKSGPHDWDALTYLCFSRYLRLDKSRSGGFVSAATALLDAGADPNTGWFEKDHQPRPVWESAIYGAAGVAHHAGLTRLLIERGADPNDEETPYHSPEGWDNDALKVLVETGKLTPDSLTTMLLRKTDWHDFEGIRFLLDRGVDTNRTSHWGKTAIHNAVLRDNALPIFECLIDHGADPLLLATQPDRSRRDPTPQSAVVMAARRGRGDVLDLFDRRGIPIQLEGIDRLLAACARNRGDEARAIAARSQELVSELRADGGILLGKFAGNGNVEGVRLLLDFGIPVDERFVEGDGYFGTAPNSTALHVAAWRARHGVVKLLIERGADVNALDGRGQSPLALAVKACVDSYWAERRSPESVELLLLAGASTAGIRVPCGYDAADKLLAVA